MNEIKIIGETLSLNDENLSKPHNLTGTDLSEKQMIDYRQ